jgi:hypothetical protein
MTPPLPALVAARSLAEAFVLRASAAALLLRGHGDLRCVNLMCEHAGGGCACRLALSAGRMPRLRFVDVSGAALPALPADLFALPALEAVAAADNALPALPPAALSAAAAGLVALDLSGNRIGSVDWAALLAGRPAPARLRRLVLTDNPLPAAHVAAARRALPGVEVVVDRRPCSLGELLDGLGVVDAATCASLR